MDLIYYKDPDGNFGDDLNEWIWDYLLPGWQAWDHSTSLLGVGTLLNKARLDPLRDRRLLIVGSGVGYGSVPTLPLPTSWDVRSVRGPQSARLLGLPMGAGLLDPAVMIPEFAEFSAIKTAGAPIFIPHHSSLGRHNWTEACRGAGVDFVSPSKNSKDVIRRIAAAPLVIAESMHAAILADSFRVPWIPIRISHLFNAAKWIDWAESLELDIMILPLFPQLDAIARLLRHRRRPGRASPPGTATIPAPVGAQPYYKKTVQRRLEGLIVAQRLKKISQQKPYLSDPAVLAGKKADYEKVLERIRVDYDGGSPYSSSLNYSPLAHQTRHVL
jgi:succinoglycan biosynthesis protein ExoV